MRCCRLLSVASIYSFEPRISICLQSATTIAFLPSTSCLPQISFFNSLHMNIYVSNLAFSFQDEQLRDLFTSFGAVSSAKVVTDRESGRSRGFGFVEMEDGTAAREAIHQLDQSTQDGRTIKVTEANERPAKSFTKSPFRADTGYSKRTW